MNEWKNEGMNRSMHKYAKSDSDRDRESMMKRCKCMRYTIVKDSSGGQVF